MTENNSPKLAQYGSTLDGIPQEKRQKCEVWTRVMGYHRPVESFNIGKKGEFNDRVCFTEKAAEEHK